MEDSASSGSNFCGTAATDGGEQGSVIDVEWISVVEEQTVGATKEGGRAGEESTAQGQRLLPMMARFSFLSGPWVSLQ